MGRKTCSSDPLRRSKVPQNITDDEATSLKIIMAILEPFAEFTDDLQGDGVTSSVVILGAINSVQCKSGKNFQNYFDILKNFVIDLLFAGAKNNQIDDDIDLNLYSKLLDFRERLCNSVITRFTTKTGTDAEDPGQVINRRIVTYDILNNKNYVLASLLDPRIKTAPFKGTLSSM